MDNISGSIIGNHNLNDSPMRGKLPSSRQIWCTTMPCSFLQGIRVGTQYPPPSAGQPDSRTWSWCFYSEALSGEPAKGFFHTLTHYLSTPSPSLAHRSIKRQSPFWGLLGNKKIPHISAASTGPLSGAILWREMEQWAAGPFLFCFLLTLLKYVNKGLIITFTLAHCSN